MYVSGPMDVETSGGGICLTRVSNVVRAATGNGTITAWITPESGDASRPVRFAWSIAIVFRQWRYRCFLPRNLAATIEASVENGGADRIEADSALGLSMETHEDGPVRASGALNGGGAVLKLRSNAGKIRLRYVDEQTALRQSLLDEQRHRLEQKLSQMGFEESASSIATAATQTATGTVTCTGSNVDWWITGRTAYRLRFWAGFAKSRRSSRSI